MNIKRCFIAFEVPGQIRRELIQVQEKLKVWPARVKWVEEENFHLTLKFLGDINDNQIEVVRKELDRLSSYFEAFKVEIKELGAFPNMYQPKIIWAGVHDEEQKLRILRNTLEENLSKAGFPKERKNFSPHLTLGRLKERVTPEGLDNLIGNIKFGPKELKVAEVNLMESVLTAKGPKYTCIHTAKLQEHSSGL